MVTHGFSYPCHGLLTLILLDSDQNENLNKQSGVPSLGKFTYLCLGAFVMLSGLD